MDRRHEDKRAEYRQRGYRLVEEIAEETQVDARKIREAVKALDLKPTRPNFDRRILYYDTLQVSAIRTWLVDGGS